MYLAEYDPHQLGGLGSKLKKLVKKVVKPIAHIGAAVVTGGASLAISAQMLARKKAEQAAKEQAARDAAEFDRQAAVLKQIQAPQLAPVAPAAAPVSTITAVAPTQAAVQQQVSHAQLQPLNITIPSNAPTYGEGRVKTARQPRAAASGTPPWLIPAGIGAAALVAVVALSGRRGGSRE